MDQISLAKACCGYKRYVLLRALARRLEAGANDDASADKRTLSEAVDRFLKNHGGLDDKRNFRGVVEYGTWRKYRAKLNLLRVFCRREGISELGDVTIDVLEDLRRTRKISLVTWKVELQTLRTFFAYFVSRK